MVMAKTKTLDKQQAQQLLDNFFKTFENACNNKNKQPQSSDFDKILANNFIIHSNGRETARNLKEYLNRVSEFQSRYNQFKITPQREYTIVEDNHLACHFNVDVTLPNGQKSQIFIMAIATIENNKITNWIQVAHERGTGKHWD